MDNANEIEAEVHARVKERMKDFTGYEGFWKPEEKEQMFPIDYEIEYEIQYARVKRQLLKEKS